MGRPQYKLNDRVYIRRCSIWRYAKPLRRKIKTVNPDRRITESFGAVGIPAAKSGKDNLVLAEMKCFHAKFVSARIGLEGAVHFRAQEFIKQICNPSIVSIRA